MKYVAYILIFAVVAVGTRIGIHHWLPRFDDGAVWSIGIFLATVVAIVEAAVAIDLRSP